MMYPWRALASLLVLSVLSVSRSAAAAAQECVTENNDAADLRAKHQFLAARDAYRACIAEPGCPGVVLAECESALSELKSAIPTLLVSVIDEQQHDAIGAVLTLDGRPVAVDGTPLEVDPGPHQLLATGRGTTVSIQVVAVENEVNRPVALVLKDPRPTSGEGPAAGRESSSAARREPTPLHTASYVLAGVGAAAAASFGYFAISGRSEFSQLESCKPDCSSSAVHEVRVKYLLADVSLGVSVATLATAGYLFYRQRAEPPAASRSLSVNIIAAPTTAALSLRWVQ